MASATTITAASASASSLASAPVSSPPSSNGAAPLPAEAEEMTMQTEGDLLRIRGDIDLYVAPVFQQRATEHIRAAEAPRIDMSEVPFLDSAGLAALVMLVREAQSTGKTLRLTVGGGLRRVLRITGIDRMMNIEE